jgi:hypothetical protein
MVVGHIPFLKAAKALEKPLPEDSRAGLAANVGFSMSVFDPLRTYESVGTLAAHWS